MKVLLKYPSRERPDKFKENIERWETYLSDSNEFHWLFSVDNDDPTLDQYQEIIRNTTKNPYHFHINAPTGKIGACNANVNEVLKTQKYDMIWLVSDDMSPEINNFDKIIEDEMTRHYPDFDGAVHINDGLQGIRLCTFSCMGVKYYHRFNYLYHPDYKSCFCDDEFTQIAWAQRRMIWIPEVLVRHEWVGLTTKDELHQKNHKIMHEDQPIYQKRAASGFPIHSVL